MLTKQYPLNNEDYEYNEYLYKKVLFIVVTYSSKFS